MLPYNNDPYPALLHDRLADLQDHNVWYPKRCHLKEGKVVKVKVQEVDDKGRMKLSMKALLPVPESTPAGK